MRQRSHDQHTTPILCHQGLVSRTHPHSLLARLHDEHDQGEPRHRHSNNPSIIATRPYMVPGLFRTHEDQSALSVPGHCDGVRILSAPSQPGGGCGRGDGGGPGYACPSRKAIVAAKALPPELHRPSHPWRADW